MSTQETSPTSTGSSNGSDNGRLQTCSECHKQFKDLKAHTLTHAKERPEKCPIRACEYHIKGFSRKYDRNRHAINHYRGTMVCGFCPGLGSTLEVSFDRLDLFKKHLLDAHKVKPKSPNERLRPESPSPPVDGTYSFGGCSICQQIFPSPSAMYDHLEDCVLAVLTYEDPTEAVNSMHLIDMADDWEFQQTMRMHKLDIGYAEANETSPTDAYFPGLVRNDTNEGASPDSAPPHRSRKRLRWNYYPSSWGYDAKQMKIKKRVAAVFCGSERLDRQETLLSKDLEVRVKLPNGKTFVTDLDVVSMNRAETVYSTWQTGGDVESQGSCSEAQLQEMRELLNINPEPLGDVDEGTSPSSRQG
ncbi:putative C2H2 finger domain protein [Dactylonectria estremocensis]|uniref:C2H2 finger domain protein n=1 Tax=Dactylonectria estremocensis TaxID=1079267 RepID=A0A9P9EL64_9HYPO|nr:putative C2H2 finger domain protein [Dactylonectria estremocensis]